MGGYNRWTPSDPRGMLAGISKLNHRDACMKIENQPVNLLILLAILILLRVFSNPFCSISGRSQGPRNKPKTPRPLKPKTEDDCPYCRGEKEIIIEKPGTCGSLRPWSEVRKRRGRRKTIFTQGYACEHPKYIYYRINDQRIHSLRGMGATGSTRSSRIRCARQVGRNYSAARYGAIPTEDPLRQR